MAHRTDALRPVTQEERVQWATDALLRATQMLARNPNDRSLLLAVVGRQCELEREQRTLLRLGETPGERLRRQRVSAARKRDYLLRPHTRGKYATQD